MAEGMVQIVERQPPTVLEAMTRGEIDVQIATAHRFPRNLKRAVDEAKSLATVTPEVAESMGYALPRAGKVIRGPSVRLAEVLGYTWGNLRYGARVVDIDDKFVTAQGVCHDLEKNVAATSEVKRRITDRAGRRYNDDMITVASNAACSIALRNAIFKVIPFALAQEVYAAAMKVAVGDMKSLAERRQRAMAYFTGTLGVEEQRVLAVLGRRSVEEVTLDDLATLTGLKTAIKDGEISLENAFPPVTKPSAFSSGTPQAPKQPAPEPPMAPAAPKPEPEQPRPAARPDAAPQRPPESPESPRGDSPQRPAAQVRRATKGPFQVPEDLVPWFGTSEIRTAGIFADTLWEICRAMTPEVLRLVDEYIASIDPPLSRPELTYLREIEGRELLERIRKATAHGSENTEQPQPTQEDAAPAKPRTQVPYPHPVDELAGETPPTEEPQPNGNGWVTCKGPHAGKRVSAAAVCARCDDRGDCPELAQHRRQAAGELL